MSVLRLTLVGMASTGEVWRLGRRPVARQHVIAAAGTSVLVLLTAFALWQAAVFAVGRVGTNDFQWTGARLVLHGIDPYRADLAGQAHRVLNQHPNYLPLLMFVLVPFGAVPFGVARLAWLLLNLGMLAASYLLIARHIGLRGRRLLVGSCLVGLGGPVLLGLGVGQQTFLVLFSSIVALRWRDRPVAGIALALAWTKYSFVPVAAGLVAQRRWRHLGVAVGVEVTATGLLCLRTGSSLSDGLFGPLRVAQTMHQGSGDIMQVLASVAPHAVLLRYAVTIAVVVGLSWLLRRRLAGADWLDQLGLGALISLLTFPHLFYDYTLLLPVAAAGWRLAGPRRVLVVGSVSVVWLLWVFGVGWVSWPYEASGMVVTMAAVVVALVALAGRARTEVADGNSTDWMLQPSHHPRVVTG